MGEEFLNFKKYKTKPVKTENCKAAVVPKNNGISINFHGKPVEPGQVVIEHEDKKGDARFEVLSKEEFVNKWVPFRATPKRKPKPTTSVYPTTPNK